jgi:hypothetical protein
MRQSFNDSEATKDDEAFVKTEMEEQHTANDLKWKHGAVLQMYHNQQFCWIHPQVMRVTKTLCTALSGHLFLGAHTKTYLMKHGMLLLMLLQRILSIPALKNTHF